MIFIVRWLLDYWNIISGVCYSNITITSLMTSCHINFGKINSRNNSSELLLSKHL